MNSTAISNQHSHLIRDCSIAPCNQRLFTLWLRPQLSQP